MADGPETGKIQPVFEWSKAIEIGHAGIDEQHQKLFDLLRDLRQAAGGAKELDAIRTGIKGLTAYAVTHFAFEDPIMDSFDYDERKSHRAAHAAFIKNVASIERSLERNKQTAGAYSKLIDFIYNWLISHINNIDRTMIAKLQGNHQDLFASHEVVSQTATVIEDAFIVAGEVERASTQLGLARNAAQKSVFAINLKDTSQRLINLLSLAETRLEIFGCSDNEMAKLSGMRGAMNSSALSLLKIATKELTDYGARIILGKYDLPLGAGAFMTRKAEEIHKLIQVVGGLENVDPGLKENIDQALSLVGDVKELEVDTLGMRDYS